MKQKHEQRAIQLLLTAEGLQKVANDTRELYAKAYGCGEWPNRFPISGGVCENWPRAAKDGVTTLLRHASELVSESLDQWRMAGKRRATWLRLKNKIIGGLGPN
jgi:hypothetical protein